MFAPIAAIMIGQNIILGLLKNLYKCFYSISSQIRASHLLIQMLASPYYYV